MTFLSSCVCIQLNVPVLTSIVSRSLLPYRWRPSFKRCSVHHAWEQCLRLLWGLSYILPPGKEKWHVTYVLSCFLNVLFLVKKSCASTEVDAAGGHLMVSLYSGPEALVKGAGGSCGVVIIMLSIKSLFPVECYVFPESFIRWDSWKNTATISVCSFSLSSTQWCQLPHVFLWSSLSPVTSFFLQRQYTVINGWYLHFHAGVWGPLLW